MSRSNLEYGAIIDADDDNDGDLVVPFVVSLLMMSRDKQILNSMASSKCIETTDDVDFTAQEDLGKPQRTFPYYSLLTYDGGFPTGSTSQTPTGKRMLWSIEYYAQFCDVDTKQVLDRCWAAIFPRTPFLDVLGGNPDLYGFFPILSYLIIRSLLDLVYHHNHPLLFVDIGRISSCTLFRYKILL